VGRQGWFDCSCCPTNIVRFLPSIAGYVYAQREGDVFVNLFVAGGAELEVDGRPLRLRQETRYPWSGRVAIAVEPEAPAELSIHVRIPGWAQGRPVPSDLYRYLEDGASPVALAVNNEPQDLQMDRGFAVVRRTWRKGDTITLELPMDVRRVLSHEKVEANAGRVALERGPIVYCAEAVDNGGRVFDLVLPDDAPLEARHREDLLGGVTVIEGRAQAPSSEGREGGRTFAAVPYYAWAHRGEGEMAVWLPRQPGLASPAP
jgi:hypothetical protein